MATPATLAIRPCAGLATNQGQGAFSLRRPSLLLPPNSSQLKTSSGSKGGASHLILQERLSLSSPMSPIRAVAIGSDQLGSSEQAQEEKPKKYHFLVANAKFMLDEEEHFKEQLYERLRHFGERNREQDFWLVIEPKFLNKFPKIAQRLKRPAVALVSTDGTWITFMKLRLDRVLSESFEADTLEEALAYNPVDLHFDKPEKWTAPYPKYEFGWWEPFLPPTANKVSS